ncbi:MAG: SRPBCC domain-containing protein [Myxococcota bacterium]
MSASASTAKSSADLELRLTRIFDAPRELVFAAWTRAEHAVHWFAPPGFRVTSCTMDLRVGGTWRSCMRWPDGSDHWQGGVFHEIVPPERLVFSYAWEDERGRPKHETIVTVRLEPRGTKTALSFHQAVFESESSRSSHGGGWNGSLDVLAEYLAKRASRA